VFKFLAEQYLKKVEKEKNIAASKSGDTTFGDTGADSKVCGYAALLFLWQSAVAVSYICCSVRNGCLIFMLTDAFNITCYPLPPTPPPPIIITHSLNQPLNSTPRHKAPTATKFQAPANDGKIRLDAPSKTRTAAKGKKKKGWGCG
jgi:hypothetical protein